MRISTNEYEVIIENINYLDLIFTSIKFNIFFIKMNSFPIYAKLNLRSGNAQRMLREYSKNGHIILKECSNNAQRILKE